MHCVFLFGCFFFFFLICCFFNWGVDKIFKKNISTVSKNIKMEITKKKTLLILLLCDTLTFRQAYPTFRHGCRSNNSSNSDQNTKSKIKKKKKSKTPNQKSKAASTGRGSMGLKGLKWTYLGFKQNYRNTKRSGIIQTSEGLRWPSMLTIRSEIVFRKEGVSTIKGLE